MRNSRDCRCYIIPPHILKNMAAHDDARIRNAAQSTLLGTIGLKAQREIFAAMAVPGLTTGAMRRTIYDADQSDRLPGTLARSENGPPSVDVAVNEAYDGCGVTHGFYKQVFHRESIDDHGMRLDSTVHFREDPDEAFDNAFWNGRQMVYGDGDGIVFGRFTASLDVIAHELTHGVTGCEANLDYHNQPGALNESFSDVFGSMVKQYHLNQTIADADWLIGKELFVEGIRSGSPAPAALRSMKAPGTGYDDPRIGRDPQPGHMSGYQHLADNRFGDWGGVHINSGIPNRAFYLACQNLGAAHSWDKAGPIWYATLRALHPRSDFIDAAKTTSLLAEQLYDANAGRAVRAAWEEVGVLAVAAAAYRAPAVAQPGAATGYTARPASP